MLPVVWAYVGLVILAGITCWRQYVLASRIEKMETRLAKMEIQYMRLQYTAGRMVEWGIEQ